MRWQILANPHRFLRITHYAIIPLFLLTIAALLIGLYQALFISPSDYQQGDAVRIMYIHVPAAYMALLLYASLALCCFFFLIFKHLLADIVAQAIAPIGAAFTLICLITGALWGQPIWGTWWVWDARLTSVLILFFIYCGYLTLIHSFDDNYRGARAASILALLGVVNLPIIKFSVEWWATLHQPASILRFEGVAIDNAMLIPLLWMMAAFSAFGFLLVVWRARTLVMIRLMRDAQHNEQSEVV